MTQIKVNTITNAAGTGAPNFPDGITINGVALSSLNTMDYYEQGTEPTSPKDGAVWYDTGTDALKVYLNDTWLEVDYTTYVPPTPYGSIGIYSGGTTGTPLNTIYKINIQTENAATDFGDLVTARYNAAGASTGSVALIIGGRDAAQYFTNVEYVTISTPGNATSFDNLTSTTSTGRASAHDLTRAVFSEYSSSSNLHYINMVTPGTSASFGNLTYARYNEAATAYNDRGLFAGGNVSTYGQVSAIDYISISTQGNAATFGTLAIARGDSSGVISSTGNAFFAGGSNGTSTLDTIDVVSTVTLGNATQFASGVFGMRMNMGGASNGDTAFFAGSKNISTSRYSTSIRVNLTTGASASYTWPFNDFNTAVYSSGIAACSGD